MVDSYLRGQDPRTVSRKELEAERLERVAAFLRKEVGMRNTNDDFCWGYRLNSEYKTYENPVEAVQWAEQDLGPDGRHYVTKVYI